MISHKSHTYGKLLKEKEWRTPEVGFILEGCWGLVVGWAFLAFTLVVYFPTYKTGSFACLVCSWFFFYIADHTPHYCDDRRSRRARERQRDLESRPRALDVKEKRESIPSSRLIAPMAEQGHVGVAPDGTKKRDEDGEDAMEFSPFWGIEKGAVLQEARCFNDSQLDARRCQQVQRFLILTTSPPPPSPFRIFKSPVSLTRRFLSRLHAGDHQAAVPL